MQNGEIRGVLGNFPYTHIELAIFIVRTLMLPLYTAGLRNNICITIYSNTFLAI
jgi:hypothetical protein